MGATPNIPRRRISVSDYQKMGEAGVFGHAERVELIDGELIQMAPIGGPHMQLVNLLHDLLTRALGGRGMVSQQNPISLPPDSEPEPDLVVLPREWLRRAEVPRAVDVLLLIEVSVSTLDYDRNVKIPLYAKHAISEVWLLDVSARTMSVYLDPAPNGYRRVLTPTPNEVVTPLHLPGVDIALSELWQ